MADWFNNLAFYLRLRKFRHRAPSQAGWGMVGPSPQHGRGLDKTHILEESLTGVLRCGSPHSRAPYILAYIKDLVKRARGQTRQSPCARRHGGEPEFVRRVPRRSKGIAEWLNSGMEEAQRSAMESTHWCVFLIDVFLEAERKNSGRFRE